MKKHLIFLILLSGISIAYAQQTSVPVIDLKIAKTIKKPIKLSEITTDVEYIELKFPPGLVNSSLYISSSNIAVGNRVIVYYLLNLERLFVFNRQGDFLHAFQEVSAGQDQISGMFGMKYWDLSPDEKHLGISTGHGISIYDINGNFTRHIRIPYKYIRFFFLGNDQIVVLKTRKLMENDGNLLFVYNLNLEKSDSLFPVSLNGRKPDPSPIPSRFILDNLYKINNKIVFQPADQNTVYQVLPELSLKPLFTIDLAEFKPPFSWYTQPREIDKYIRFESLIETKDYYITELQGPALEDRNVCLETLVFNKSTDEYFTVERLSNDPEKDDYSISVVDDLDGCGYLNYQFNNGLMVSSVDPAKWKQKWESDTTGNKLFKNGRYVDKLQAVIENSDPDSPILRMLQLDKPGKNQKKLKFNPKYPIYAGLSPVIPVRTNHQWKNAASLSDIAYDPSDDSFWLVKMRFGGGDTIEHRSRSGETLQGTFITPKDIEVEAITASTIDTTLWMSDTRTQSILHYDRLGNNLGNGFKPEGVKSVFGMAYDSSDGTLWLLDDVQILWHFSTAGVRLNDGYNPKMVGCDEGRGMVYDPRDNSLWILNSSPHKLIHIDKAGKLLPGSFYYDPFLGLPDGVALDFKGFEFWIGDWSRRWSLR